MVKLKKSVFHPTRKRVGFSPLIYNGDCGTPSLLSAPSTRKGSGYYLPSKSWRSGRAAFHRRHSEDPLHHCGGLVIHKKRFVLGHLIAIGNRATAPDAMLHTVAENCLDLLTGIHGTKSLYSSFRIKSSTVEVYEPTDTGHRLSSQGIRIAVPSVQDHLHGHLVFFRTKLSILSECSCDAKHLVLKGLGVPVSDPLSTGRGFPKKEEPPTGGGDGGFRNSVSISAAANRNLMLF